MKTIRGQMPYSSELSLPHVPGHEVAGRVIEVDGGGDVAVGDRIVVHHIWACGRCAACRRGDENICREYKAWLGFTDPVGFRST